MCGNRVEELEQRVKELEASVEGLTDELVECKVRIRELENTVDEQNGFSDSTESTSVETDPEPAADAEAAEEAAESAESEGGDIIVPEADTPNTQAPEEADKTADPEAEAESESEDDSGSDIIVA